MSNYHLVVSSWKNDYNSTNESECTFTDSDQQINLIKDLQKLLTFVLGCSKAHLYNYKTVIFLSYWMRFICGDKITTLYCVTFDMTYIDPWSLQLSSLKTLILKKLIFYQGNNMLHHGTFYSLIHSRTYVLNCSYLVSKACVWQLFRGLAM